MSIGPLQAQLETAGLGHVAEIADGDAPHTPRGCPFQAWSLGDLLRALALWEKASRGAMPNAAPVIHTIFRMASRIALP